MNLQCAASTAQASATLVRNKINTHAKEHKIQHQTATAGKHPLDKFLTKDCRIKTKRHKKCEKRQHTENHAVLSIDSSTILSAEPL